MASDKIITDKEIIDAAKAIFGIDDAKGENEMIKFECHFGTIHLNKNNI